MTTRDTSARYKARPVKRRRASQDEMVDRHLQLALLVRRGAPMTVRQVFYQAVVHGIVEKSEADYGKVQRALVELRRRGWVRWSDIADNTRWMRKPETYSGLRNALEIAAQTYRRQLACAMDAYVELWLEKDSLAAILYDLTESYDIPLMTARGFPSQSFVYSASECMRDAYKRQGRRAVVYYLGDHDPSGVLIDKAIRRGLHEHLRDEVPFIVERLAVLPQQIKQWQLPTRPTKRAGNRHAKAFAGDSVELDAIDPRRLRSIARRAIESHFDADELARLRRTEQLERDTLKRIAANGSPL